MLSPNAVLALHVLRVAGRPLTTLEVAERIAALSLDEQARIFDEHRGIRPRS